MTENIVVPDRLKLGPRESVSYPIAVDYCGNCSMPIEVNKFLSEFFNNFCCLNIHFMLISVLRILSGIRKM